MPHANRMTVGIMALVAEDEGRRISQRTKDALEALKMRGKKSAATVASSPPPGCARARYAGSAATRGARAADIAPMVNALQAAGKTRLREIAAGLNEQGIPTARGC
jgi:DNA invertase Pin-like site-specific DNA recombinase